MKSKVWCLIAVWAIACLPAIGQEPASGKPLGISMLLINDEGSTMYEDLMVGDKLVYQVSAGDMVYQFVVKPLSYTMETGIHFTYSMTSTPPREGEVKVLPQAKENSRKYVNFFSGGLLRLEDACSVWLSDANFNDLVNGKTIMTMDDQPPQTFSSPDDVVQPEILWKGEKRKVDGFRLVNTDANKADKEIWVQNISANPLILYMNRGWTVRLIAVE